MGNCCGSPAAPDNNVRHKRGERVANWQATGVIGLRQAKLKELPMEVAQVARPRVLDASDNALERLPESLPTSLQRLVLSNNRLSSQQLGAIQALQNLRVLMLDGNRVEALPDSIGSLNRLEVLSLSGNLLARLPPSLGRLQHLRRLLVARNRLAALPDELGDCSSLEELDAQHNMLRVLPASLGRLQRLKMLQLDGNQINSLPPEILHGCSALATISLHDNPITPDTLQATDGFQAFEARRQGKYSKTLDAGVLLGKRGLDEGVDRPVAARL